MRTEGRRGAQRDPPARPSRAGYCMPKWTAEGWGDFPGLGRREGRQREVFPLPLVEDGGDGPLCCSRSVRRRFERRHATSRQVNRTIAGLNALYFGVNLAAGGKLGQCAGPLTQAQVSVHSHLWQCCERLGTPPEGLHMPGAIIELRHAPSGYQGEPQGAGKVASFSLEKRSLPSGEVDPVPLLEVLEGFPRDALKRHRDIIECSPDEWGSRCDKARSVPIYSDPVVARQPQVMTAFGVELVHRRIARVSTRRRGRVGAFSSQRRAAISASVWTAGECTSCAKRRPP